MDENIISIRNHDKLITDDEFSKFMKLTEDYLNKLSEDNPKEIANLTASQLEQVSVSAMKEIAPQTPFRSEEIQLVSAQTFPDIIAEKYYGVEVKSTKQNHWTSTGSSIVESTRNQDVNNIYMLFGKLGGNPPEFKCKPYQDCLYDIAVTHSPRYLINMELEKNETIFSKMGTTYDDLRTSPDSIEQVRNYYRNKASRENKKEMPWWLSGSAAESAFNVRHFSSLTQSEKHQVVAEMFLLFPSIIGNTSSDKFINVSLWLCTYHYILASNLRDCFSAGGKMKYVDGVELINPVPAIIGRVVSTSATIKELLDNPSDEILSLVKEFNPNLLKKGEEKENIYDTWIDVVEKECNSLVKTEKLPVRKWIENECILSVKLKS